MLKMFKCLHFDKSLAENFIFSNTKEYMVRTPLIISPSMPFHVPSSLCVPYPPSETSFNLKTEIKATAHRHWLSREILSNSRY